MQKKIDQQQQVLAAVVSKLSSGKQIADMIFQMDTDLIPKRSPSSAFVEKVSSDPSAAKKAINASINILTRALEKVSAGKEFADSIIGEDVGRFLVDFHAAAPLPQLTAVAANPPAVPANIARSQSQASSALPVPSNTSGSPAEPPRGMLVGQTAQKHSPHPSAINTERQQMMRHQLAAADEMPAEPPRGMLVGQLPTSIRNSQANVKLQHQKAQKATLKVGNPSEYSMHSPTAKRTKMTHMNPAETYQPASLIEESATVMTKQKVSRHLLPDDPDKQDKADKKKTGVEEVKHEDLKGMTGYSYPQAAADSVSLKMDASSNTSKAHLDMQSADRGGESVAALVFIIVLAAFLGFCSIGGLTYLVVFGPTGKEESSPLSSERPANAAHGSTRA